MPLKRVLLLPVLVLFQSHWVDDLMTGGPDAAGVIVSALGTLPIAAGLYGGERRRSARLALLAGLVFVLYISTADLVGLQPDGSLATSMREHWRTTLGWPITAAVAATLAAAAGSLALWSTRRAG